MNISDKTKEELIKDLNIAQEKISELTNIISGLEDENEDLKHLEERYKMIMSIANDYIFSIKIEPGGKLNIDWRSGSYEKITGYTKEEIEKLDNGLISLLFHGDKKKFDKILKQLQDEKYLLSNSIIYNEFRIIKKNGQIAWLRNYLKPIKDDKHQKVTSILGVMQDITESKEALEALQESEEKFRNIIEYSRDGIAIIDSDFKIIGWNKGNEEITGYKKEEVIGSFAWDLEYKIVKDNLRSAEFYEMSKIMYKKILSNAESPWINKLWENNIIAADGTRKIVQQSVFTIPNSGGTKQNSEFRIQNSEEKYQVSSMKKEDGLDFENFKEESGRYFVVISRDITVQRTAEEKIKENESKFRLLAENSQDMIYRISLKPYFKIEYISPATKLVTGYSPFEYYDDSGLIFNMIYPDDRNIFDDILKKRESIHNNVHLRMIKKDGGLIWVEITNVPIFEDNGEVIAIEGSARDITKRKRVEIALEEREKTMRAILAVSPVGIVLSKNLLVEWSNEAIYKILGYKEEELIGLHSSSFFQSPKEFEKIKAKATIELDEKGFTSFETKFKKKNGKKLECLVGLSRVDINSAELNNIIAIMDISKLKQTERELEESKEELRAFSAHLQNMIEKERISIAREIHDEFGQVLSALKINLSYLYKSYSKEDIRHKTQDTRLRTEEKYQVSSIKYQGSKDKSDDKKENRQDKIQINEEFVNEIEGMKKIIDEAILKLRQLLTSLRPEVLENLGLIDGLAWQAEEFQKRTKIKVNFSGNISKIELDKELAISIYRIFQESLTNIAKHSDASNVKININRIENQLILEIRDDGIGISLENMKKRDTFGMLGMRERAKIYNGELKISSKIGHGTSVKLKIPIEND